MNFSKKELVDIRNIIFDYLSASLPACTVPGKINCFMDDQNDQFEPVYNFEYMANIREHETLLFRFFVIHDNLQHHVKCDIYIEAYNHTYPGECHKTFPRIEIVDIFNILLRSYTTNVVNYQ